MDFSAGIEIDDPLLVALSKHNALAFIEVHIRAIELYEFPYSHSGGRKQVNHCQVSDVLAVIPENLHILI